MADMGLAGMGSNVNGLGGFGIGVAGASVPVMAGMHCMADGGVIGFDRRLVVAGVSVDGIGRARKGVAWLWLVWTWLVWTWIWA